MIETRIYREYITESIRLRNENKYLSDRWIDIVKRKPDTRSGDEIAIDVVQRAGLTLKSGEDSGCI